MQTTISELSSLIVENLDENRKKVAKKFQRQQIDFGSPQKDQIFSIRSGYNDYLFIPNEMKEGKRQVIGELIASSARKGIEPQRYYLVVQPSFKGFEGNVELFNKRAKKITNVPYRIINGGDPDPTPSYRYVITSREVVIDDDGNKNLILDGTKGNNVHWYINVVLNEYNYPVTVVTSNLP